jgi:hypothetical protein
VRPFCARLSAVRTPPDTRWRSVLFRPIHGYEASPNVGSYESPVRSSLGIITVSRQLTGCTTVTSWYPQDSSSGPSTDSSSPHPMLLAGRQCPGSTLSNHRASVAHRLGLINLHNRCSRAAAGIEQFPILIQAGSLGAPSWQGTGRQQILAKRHAPPIVQMAISGWLAEDKAAAKDGYGADEALEHSAKALQKAQAQDDIIAAQAGPRLAGGGSCGPRYSPDCSKNSLRKPVAALSRRTLSAWLRILPLSCTTSSALGC